VLCGSKVCIRRFNLTSGKGRGYFGDAKTYGREGHRMGLFFCLHNQIADLPGYREVRDAPIGR